MLRDTEHEPLPLDVDDDDARLAADALAADDLDRRRATAAGLPAAEAALRDATVQHPHEGEHDAERERDAEGDDERVHRRAQTLSATSRIFVMRTA